MEEKPPINYIHYLKKASFMEFYQTVISLICGIALGVFAKGMYSETKNSMKDLNDSLSWKGSSAKKFEKQEGE